MVEISDKTPHRTESVGLGTPSHRRVPPSCLCFESCGLRFDPIDLAGASIMGKYVLGWIMGVPLFVLVILYLIFH
jgi:hypothetical protein